MRVWGARGGAYNDGGKFIKCKFKDKRTNNKYCSFLIRKMKQIKLKIFRKTTKKLNFLNDMDDH